MVCRTAFVASNTGLRFTLFEFVRLGALARGAVEVDVGHVNCDGGQNYEQEDCKMVTSRCVSLRIELLAGPKLDLGKTNRRTQN